MEIHTEKPAVPGKNAPSEFYHAAKLGEACLMAKKPEPLETRFWRNVEKGDGCWLWTGQKCARGYGRITLPGHKSGTGAHRVSLMLHGRIVPRRSVVLHLCDTPACVRPDHLQVGTHQTNQADKVRKGRQAKGERQGSAVLSAIEVKAMRQLRDDGWTCSDIGAAFGRSYPAVHQAVTGETWAHLTYPIVDGASRESEATSDAT